MTIDILKFSSAEIERLRSETPGTRHRVHLNNTGAALMPSRIVSAATEYLNREAEIGRYETKAERTDQLERGYESVARLIGAAPGEIALAENATVAWQWALYAQAFKPGDRILTTTAEYAASYRADLQVAARQPKKVPECPLPRHGSDRAKPAPFGECGGAAFLDILSADEGAFLIEPKFRAAN